MDKILSFDNWWDGPLLGLCTFKGVHCIYERVFSPEKDDYTEFYYLTPVDNETALVILENWRKWCKFMNSGGDARLWKSGVDIKDAAKLSPRFRKYKKRGTFNSERPENFYSERFEMFAVWE